MNEMHMNAKVISRKAPRTKAILASICAAALALAMLSMTGCAQPMQSQDETPVVTPSDYMVSLNASAEDLKSVLTEFSEAAANDDVFTMQTKADEASAVLDSMSELEAPEAMSEVKSKYGEAVSTLKGALSDYLELYLELDDAQHGGSAFDYSTYDNRLEAIQKQYDKGLNQLEDADKLASDHQSSSSSQSSASQGA